MTQQITPAGTTPGGSPSLPPGAFDSELLEEAARAVRSIPKDEITGSTPLEVRDSVARMLLSPAFARFRELVDRHNASAVDADSFKIKSVSFGIEASIAFGVGAQGSFGVAVPPGDWENFEEYVVYLTAAVEVGVIEGALGGVVLGLYNVQPTGMAGGSYGFEVVAGVVEEVELEASFQHADRTGFLGIAITEAGGEEDGIDGEYSYTWIWNWDAPYAYQPPAANYMLLSSIKCNEVGESGHDEIYFKFTPDNGTTYRYPTTGQFSMAPGDPAWNAGRSIYFNNQVVVELFDEDSGSQDDPRGSHTYSASGFATSVTVGANGGSYTLSAVLNPPPTPFVPGKRINSLDISPQGPSACLFNGKSYLVWMGTNSYLYASGSADGVTWPNGAKINTADTTPVAPAAVAFNGQLFVIWKGSSNNGIYWSASDDGVTWPYGQILPGESPFASPAACVFNGTLYLFWSLNDSTRRIVYSVFNASTRSWSAHQPINSSAATSTAVAAAAFNGALYVFSRSDSSRQMYVTSSASQAWPSGVLTNSGESSSCAPGVCLDNGKLYVLFDSTNAAMNLRYMTSTDGRTYSASTISSGANVTNLPPAASVFNGKMSLFFTNPAQQLCVSGESV